MQAIIHTCGKQYDVTEGQLVYLEKLPNEAGDEVTFDEVIAVVDGANSSFGAPFVEGASVTGKVVRNGKGKKINVFKYRPKKGSATRQGHRQPYTAVQIEKITVA